MSVLTKKLFFLVVGVSLFFSAYSLETTDRAFEPVMGLKSVTVKESNWYGFKPFANGYKGFSWESWTSCGIMLQYPDGSEHEFTSDDFETEIVNDFTITDDGKYLVRAIGRTEMLEALDLATEESVWGVYFPPPTQIHNVDEADDDYFMVSDDNLGYVMLVEKNIPHEVFAIYYYDKYCLAVGGFENGFYFSVGAKKWSDPDSYCITLFDENFEVTDEVKANPGGFNIERTIHYLDAENNTVFLYEDQRGSSVYAYVADDGDLAVNAKWRELVVEGIGYVSGSFKWNGETYYVGVKGDKLYLLYWDGAEIKRSEEPFAKLGSRYNHCAGVELVDGNLVIYECAEPK